MNILKTIFPCVLNNKLFSRMNIISSIKIFNEMKNEINISGH